MLQILPCISCCRSCPPDIVHRSAPRYRLRKLASAIRWPLWRCNHAGHCIDPLALLNGIIELLCFNLISKGFMIPAPYFVVIPLQYNPYKQGVCYVIDTRKGAGMRHATPYRYRIQLLPNFRKMDLQSAPCMAPRFRSSARKRQLT